MIPEFEPAIRDFLERFFGEDNFSKLRTIYEPASKHAILKPFVDRLDKTPQPTVLPFTDAHKKVVWFGLAFDDGQYAQLADGLFAFMGPSFSTFHRGKLQYENHPAVPYVHDITNGRYFAFEADNEHVREQLLNMLNLWKRRPLGRMTKSNDMNWLLRDFHTSLEAGDQPTAEANYEAIKEQGQLSSQNMLFLQIQMLSSFELWEKLFSLQGIREVIAARRPLAVTEALLTGLYNQHVVKFEQSADVEGAVRTFREEVWPLYGNLFQSRRGLRRIEAIKCHALRAAALPEQDISIEDLQELLKVEDFYRSLLAQARSGDPRSTEARSYVQAQQEMDKGNVDVAFDILLSLPPSTNRTSGLLECAFLLLDLASMKQGLEAFEVLTEDQQNEILANRRLRSTLQVLQTMGMATEEPARSIPGNWNEWLTGLVVLDEGYALEIAKQGAAQWQVQHLHEQDPGLADFYANLAFVENEAQTKRKFRLSVIHLLAFFRKDAQWPRQEWTRVYILLLGHLLRGSGGSIADIRYYGQMLREIGQLNLDTEEYRQLLQPALEWVENYATKATSDPIAELLDMLGSVPCPDPVIRLRLLHTAVRQFQELPEPLKEIRGRLMPRSWPAWFAFMEECSASSEFLLDLMPERESMEWGHTIIDQMVETLVDPCPEIEQKLESITPRLVISALEDPSFPRQELRLFYETLLMLMDARLSRNYDNTLRFVGMMEGMLRLYPESAELRWREVEGWLSGTPFAAIADLVVDLFDLFFDSPLANERMMSLWSKWSSCLMEELTSGPRLRMSHWLRIGERVGGLYEQVSQLRTALASESSEDPIAKLSHQTITIFSLSEKPAVRAIEYLNDRNPALQLRYCTDDRLTDRAKEYARNSDICVVVTTCISHALTNGIKEYLPRSPLYPRSSGDSSIIDAIEEYAKKL